MILQQTEETSLSRWVNYIFGSLAHLKCASNQQERIISKSSEAVSSDPFLNLMYHIFFTRSNTNAERETKTDPITSCDKMISNGFVASFFNENKIIQVL